MPENMPKPSMLPASNHLQYAFIFSFIATCQHLFVCHLLCPTDLQHSLLHPHFNCFQQFLALVNVQSNVDVINAGVKAGDNRKDSKSSSRLSSVEASQQRLLCAVCGRQFVHVTAFQRHSQSHVAARDRCYLCSVCGHRAATAEALRRHSAVHLTADQRPLACAHCDRRFVRAGDLRKHVRIHIGDRPYQCSLCGRAFSRNYSLLAHGRMHAARSALRPCVRCLRTFRSAAGLAAHRKFCVHPNK